MKILFLAPQPFFEVRGTPINVKLVVTALSELDNDIDLLVYPHGNDVEIDNVKIRRVLAVPGLGKAPIGPSKSKLVYDAIMFVQVIWMTLWGRYDVIHAVEESAFMAWILSKIFRIPFIFDMDSHMSEQLEYSSFVKSRKLLSFAENVESAALKSASAIITVCPYLTNAAKRATNPDRVFQIEDIPMDFPTPPKDMTVDSLRIELGIEPKEEVVLYTGNLEPYQGIDLLLESASHVVGESERCKFVVVGGSQDQIDYYSMRTNEFGLDGRVIFTGAKPMDHMPIFHDMADILLSPRVEGTNTPLKLYTYLQTGKPVVATDLPTHNQLLNTNVAVLAKAEKMEYAAAILLLLKDKSMRLDIGKKGRDFVERDYNYKEFKRKLELAYKTVATQ